MLECVAPHPRLYLDAEALARVRQPSPLPILQEAQRRVETCAEQAVLGTDFDYRQPSHNDLLVRARRMQERLVSLLVRWEQTGQARFRSAALAHVQAMAGWPDWSWIAMRQGDHAPDAIFDLSYGENAASLAIAYSWLHAGLSADERGLFIAQARDRALAAFVRHTRPEARAWWFGKTDSNWNTVCAGGAGMLALAMAEDLPELAEVAIARVEESLTPFIQGLAGTTGGWPEGIGYWNYAFRYAFMYLLSWERAMRRPHPLMATPALAETLAFNLHFCPNGIGCSFGDVNAWSPMPFHLAACRRLARPELAAELLGRIDPGRLGASDWPVAAELLLLHPGSVDPAPEPQPGFAKHYQGLDWVALADRFPRPRLYVSVRGGTTEVPHAHLDLLSYQVVVEDEAMVCNLGVDEYLDTTFSERRWELFETTPPSKNTILVNGVGIARPARVATSLVAGQGVRGVRLDASEAMGRSRDGAAVRFAGRLILLLDERALLVLDRVELPFPGRVESRLHSHAEVVVDGASAELRGERQRLSLRYAADRPALLATAIDAPTSPLRSGAHLLRWCSRELVTDAISMATLMLPGGQEGSVAVASEGDGLRISVHATGLDLALRVDARLHLTD